MTASNRRRFVLACQQAFAIAVVTTIAVPAASLVELDILGPGDGDASAAAPAARARAVSVVTSAPVAPTVSSVPLQGVSSRGLQALRADHLTARRAADRFAVLSAPVPTTGFATVGVTWAHDVRLADDDISVAVRTSERGTWSDWETLDYDADHGPDPGSAEARRASRPGTDAMVVGDVDDVQVRATTADGTVPEDMRLAVVDPGVDVHPRTAAPAIDTGAPEGATGGDAQLVASALTGPALVTPKPQIFSRAQWGADERLRDRSSLHYGEIHAAFVHHTVNANDYSRADVPALLRGIYAYHTQSRGWSDVGYNFLVDRFGQIWEGRYGGVGRPVVGAHTLGYNDDAFAMSAIGNFEVANPPQAVVDAYARLFAWKLSLHGVDAGSTRQWVTSKYFQAINGHRDAGQTACPGKYLYARIPDIRRAAAQLQRPFGARNRFGDLSGNAWPDLVARRGSDHHLVVVRTGGQISFRSGISAAAGWGSAGLRAALGDVTGDRYGDLLARLGSAPVTLFAGDGKGHFSPVRSYTRFDGYDRLTGVGDFNGDGRNDVVGRAASTHDLSLFPGRSGGGFGAPVRLARGWDYDDTFGVDDVDRDGRRDLVARQGGRLFLVPGTGSGLRAPVPLRGDWSGFDVVTGRGDLTGDGIPDLLARRRDSRHTWIFPGDGAGSFGTRLGPYGRFASLPWFVAGPNVGGSVARDVVGLGADGATLRVFPHAGRRNLGRRPVDTGLAVDDLNLVLNAGDWDADGHGDLMYRVASTGALMLVRGLGADRYAAPVRAGTGWNGVGMVAPVGDVTGDGYPDLMGRGRGGDLRIYPSNGRTGFRGSYVAHSAISADRQVGVGLFTDDGAPDNLLRRSDGTVWLWSGNGPGGLVTGRQVAKGTAGYSWFLGLGDLDGDGHADVVARDRRGVLWLLKGTGAGLAPRRIIGTGFGGYDYAG